MVTKSPKAGRPGFAGYGIVGADQGEGLLPWSWARDRLEKTANYFIATTRPDGRPHVMIVWGLWLDESFHFSTSPTSVKAKNLAANPHCTICPGDADEAVIVEGVCEEVSDRGFTGRFFAAYKDKYDMDVSGMGSPIYTVRPRVVYGQIEKTFTKTATRWTFE
jgi:hypothetical protein